MFEIVRLSYVIVCDARYELKIPNFIKVMFSCDAKYPQDNFMFVRLTVLLEVLYLIYFAESLRFHNDLVYFPMTGLDSSGNILIT